MTPHAGGTKRQHELDRLLAEALRQPTASRGAFLETVRADDPDLAGDLARLLREAGDADPFLKAGGALEGPLWDEMAARPTQLAAGTRLGPYEIQSAIGAGGMGEVYRARDTRLGRDVAVKILPPGSVAAGDALARFELEARAVAALDHPNIVAIHDVGTDGRHHFVVTELLEGETLRKRLGNGQPLAPSKAIDYGIQIARGLAAAHGRGIVHRDLKPDNVFITGDGRVKVLDFGIASFEPPGEDNRDLTRLTQAGVVLGTMGYTSPEQLLGRPATAQSDLFAFGVVMHEMITGRHPFARATAVEMQTAVLRDDPTSILRASPGLTPAVARLVERCLQKQPGDRPETARDVALFLEAMSGSIDMPAGAAIAAAPVRLEQQRRVRLIAAGCALLAVLTAVLWGYARVSVGSAARATINADFGRGERSVRRRHAEQVTRLELTARLVTSFPELKALLSTDVATVEDFLLGYQQRLATRVVFVALGPDGSVLGRTDSSAALQRGDGEGWLKFLSAAQGTGAIVNVGERPHLAAAAPSEAGGTVFGYVVAAEPINQALAEAIREDTQDEVVLLTNDAVLGSTLRAGQKPWPSLAAWRAAGGRAGESMDVRIGSDSVMAREVALTSDPAVSVLLVKSWDEAIRPFNPVARGLLAIGAITLVAAMLGGAWLARLR